MLVPLVFYPAFFAILARLVVYLMQVTSKDTREQAYETFLALLTHQLRHPASTAAAIIDQLERGKSSLPTKQRQYIDMLKTENQNLLQLLNNLLETAGAASYVSDREGIELPQLLQKLAYQSAKDHQRDPDLKLKLEDMSLVVPGDGGKLGTALLNLLNNAFQYSDADTPVNVSVHKAGSNVVVIVEDKGSGMAKQVKRRMFEKYRVHESTEHGVRGLGLGLFVARKIITDQGGSLHVVTDKLGTRVIITLRRGKA
jgi:signal transduction histidine kinase